MERVGYLPVVNISGMSVLVAFSSESLFQFFGGLSVLSFVLRLNGRYGNLPFLFSNVSLLLCYLASVQE